MFLKITVYFQISSNEEKVDLHVEDDVVHELAEAGLDGPLELGRLHQRVHKLEDGKH